LGIELVVCPKAHSEIWGVGDEIPPYTIYIYRVTLQSFGKE